MTPLARLEIAVQAAAKRLRMGVEGPKCAEELEAAMQSLRAEASRKVCGRCLGRGKKDIAHGETAPCDGCSGTGIIAPDDGETVVCPIDGLTESHIGLDPPHRYDAAPPSGNSATAIFFGRGDRGRPHFEIVEIVGDEPAIGTKFYAGPYSGDVDNFIAKLQDANAHLIGSAVHHATIAEAIRRIKDRP